MLISHSHRFIFVHIPKTAGTSITRALLPTTVPTWWRLLRRPTRRLRQLHVPVNIPIVRWKVYPDHITASELQAELAPRVFSTYFKFAVVRNPWDWCVSLYHYIRADQRHPDRHVVRALTDFDSFLDWMLADPPLPQVAYVCAPNGDLLVDRVLRFERLEADFSKVLAHIGVSAELPHANRTSRTSYHTYYSTRTRQLISDLYAEDVARFSYEF